MSELLTAKADTKVAGSELAGGKAEMRNQRPGIPAITVPRGIRFAFSELCVGRLGVISNQEFWNSRTGVRNH